MARINIEDELFRDQRYLKFIAKIGDPYKALGMICSAWIIAQRNWLSHKSIPEKSWDKDLNILIEFEFVDQLDDGSYYVKGSRKAFEWLEQKSSAGKKGGEKNKERLTNAIRTPDGRLTSEIPLSLSPPLSLKKEEEPTQEKLNSAEREDLKATASELERCVSVWGETLRELGIQKDPRSDDHILARLLQKYSKPDQVYHMVRGQRWETGGPTWDVRKHLSLQKVFNDPAKAEKLENLSRSKPAPGASVEPNGIEEAKEYGRKLKEEREKLLGYDQLNNDGWK